MLRDVCRPKAGLDFPEELAMFRQRPGFSLAVLALGALAVAAQSDEDAGFVPVTDAMLQDPAPGDWLTWRRTLDGWGFRLGTWGNLLATKAIGSLSTYSFPSFRPSF